MTGPLSTPIRWEPETEKTAKTGEWGEGGVAWQRSGRGVRKAWKGRKRGIGEARLGSTQATQRGIPLKQPWACRDRA